MSVGKYAVIKNGDIIVLNIIVADKTFSLKGHYLVNFSGATLCQEGMFYNVKDGRFYDNETFTLIGDEPAL